MDPLDLVLPHPDGQPWVIMVYQKLCWTESQELLGSDPDSSTNLMCALG